MSAASPYRIAGERPVWAEPVAPRVVAVVAVAPPPADSEPELEGVASACEYVTAEDHDPTPRPDVLPALVLCGGLIVLGGLTIFALLL